MRILLAIDGSSCSDAAVNEVIRWHWPPQSAVRLITVDAPLAPSMAQGSPSAFDEVVNLQRTEMAKWLLDASKRLAQQAPSLRVSSAILSGWPKEVIVNEAERYGADVVVVGSHGYGPIRRFFLGSVSLFVAHHAPCSVLIVRPSPEIAPIQSTPETV